MKLACPDALLDAFIESEFERLDADGNLVSTDGVRLLRSLALQPAGQRYAPKRIEKRKAADEGWEMVDHMTRKARKVVDECLSCDDDED